MEGLHLLEHTILDLLGTHQCVTIPGLGSFIYRDYPASSNHFTLELKPSGNTIFFNHAIQGDDGLLANRIRETNGGSYSDALAWIKTRIEEIQNHLHDKKNLAFGKLGNFFLNADKQVFFLPSGQLNLSKSSFGLPVLKLSELEKAKTTIPAPRAEVIVETPKPAPVALAETEIEEAEVLELDEPVRQRHLAWRIAAAFAVVTLASSAWYFGRQYFNQHEENIAQSASMDLVAGKDTTVKNIDSVPVPHQESQSIAKSEKKKASNKGKEKSGADAIVNGNARRLEVTSPIIGDAEFKNTLEHKSGRFYLIGGTYVSESMAKKECAKWNKVGVNATLFRSSNSALIRVLLGRFNSEKAASAFMTTMPGFHGSTVALREIQLIR